MSVVACSSPVEVTLYPGADFTRYRTWDWLPGEALVVHVPDSEADRAELRVSHAIVEALRSRGFERDRESPDLRVGVVVAIRSHVQIVRQTGAVESVYTYHDGGSWEVQAEETSVERLDHLRLEVYISEARRGRLVWEARLADSVNGSGVERLDEWVRSLLAELPAPRVVGRLERRRLGRAAV